MLAAKHILCKDCGKRFRGGGKRLDNISLWREYVGGRRTLVELATSNKCSERTTRRRLSLVADHFVSTFPDHAVVIVDTTCFGRSFGVMLFLDAHTGIVLHRKYVKSETNALYSDGQDFRLSPKSP